MPAFAPAPLHCLHSMAMLWHYYLFGFVYDWDMYIAVAELWGIPQLDLVIYPLAPTSLALPCD